VTLDSEDREVLLRHRRVWDVKPVLRRIYNEEFFGRMLSFQKPSGPSVEVGAGPGFFKKLFPGAISTDLVWSEWLDAVADAQRLPFQSSSVTNLFGLDVLHHLAAPMKFLHEAERILAPSGRLILVEPWVTPFSYLIYRYLHQEGCDLSALPGNPDDGDHPREKKAFEGNPAIPYLLFGPRYRSRTLASLPSFSLLAAEPFCLFAYLLSGGFKPFNLLPEFSYPLVSRFERATLPLWRRAAALRILLVLEKRVPPQVRPMRNKVRLSTLLLATHSSMQPFGWSAFIEK
jgi:SAM-dependent methyltransferase